MIQSASAMTSRLCSIDDRRVAGVDQAVQHPDQLLDVRHVQADGRLVEHVQGLRGTRSSTARRRA